MIFFNIKKHHWQMTFAPMTFLPRVDGGVFLSSMCFVSVQFHQVSIGSNVAIVLMSLAWTKSLAAPLVRETCGSRGGDDMTNSYRPWVKRFPKGKKKKGFNLQWNILAYNM